MKQSLVRKRSLTNKTEMTIEKYSINSLKIIKNYSYAIIQTRQLNLTLRDDSLILKIATLVLFQAHNASKIIISPPRDKIDVTTIVESRMFGSSCRKLVRLLSNCCGPRLQPLLPR